MAWKRSSVRSRPGPPISASIPIAYKLCPGLGQTKPTGSLYSSYGTFGTANAGFNLSFGGAKVGNYISANGLNTGRFLDPPEFQVMHSRGNEQNLFDRLDFQLTSADALHLNTGFTRSWFQVPNSFDSQFVQNPVAGGLVLQQDQRAQIKTFNVAPTYTHLFGSTTLFTAGAFVRRDHFEYFPSGNVLADFPQTLNQSRFLTNAGFRSDVSYVKGIHT